MYCKQSNLLILVLSPLFVRTVKNYDPCKRLKLCSNTYSTSVLRTKFFIRLNGPLEMSMYVLKRSPKNEEARLQWFLLTCSHLPLSLISTMNNYYKARERGKQPPQLLVASVSTLLYVACFSDLLHEVWNWSNWTWAKNSQHFICCVIKTMLHPLALLF